MHGAIIDCLITSARRTRVRKRGLCDARIRYVPTAAGHLRVLDTGGRGPVLVLTPDLPCVIEHYRRLIAQLSGCFRVVCFDMPGVGFSFPGWTYGFGMSRTADVILELLDALSIARSVLAFTCVNGFCAMNLAGRHPARVSHLVLVQTPSLESMRQWTDRNIPRALRVPYAGQVLNALTARRLAARWFHVALPRGCGYRHEFVARSVTALAAGGCFCLASVAQGLLHVDENHLRHVRCPTLAVHGDADCSHRHTDFNSTRELIPHARIATFHGCGHFPDLEKSGEYVHQVQHFVLCNG